MYEKTELTEEEWLEALNELILQAEDMPMHTAEFLLFMGYIKALYQKYKDDLRNM